MGIMSIQEALDLIADEAITASKEHDAYNSHHEAHSVIEEEFDEYWDLVKLNPRKPMIHPTKGYVLDASGREDELRDELIQLAATCVRALYDLC